MRRTSTLSKVTKPRNFSKLDFCSLASLPLSLSLSEEFGGKQNLKSVPVAKIYIKKQLPAYNCLAIAIPLLLTRMFQLFCYSIHLKIIGGHIQDVCQ